MTAPIIFQLTLGSRLRAGCLAFTLLFLGGLALWAGLEEGLPRDWGMGVVDVIGALLVASGARFAYVAGTGRASELMADILQDIGRIHWHG
jgi:hypothetical protein